MLVTHTPHITVMLRTTKSAINQKANVSETLHFTPEIVVKIIGSGIKVEH